MIVARDTIRLQGEDSQGLVSRIGGTSAGASSNASVGSISIATRNLEILDGTRLGIAGIGRRNAGDLSITASGTIRLQGKNSQDVGSIIVSDVGGIDEQGNRISSTGNGG